MKNYWFFLFLSGMLFATGCKPSGQGAGVQSKTPGPADAALTFEQREFNRQSPGCEQDSNQCARVSAVYPLAVAGPEEAARRINDTIGMYLRISLAVFAPAPEDIPESLDSIADNFLKEYETVMAEEDGLGQAWSVELDGQVLYQSENLVSVELNTYSYAGGAHPNSFVYLINFDAVTGKALHLNDIVRDTARLRELAEVHFREARELGVDESLSDAGFFWGESFALPENYALTEEGLYFYYNPYEIAAYVVGPTSFTISREQMAGLLAEGY